MLTIKDLVEGNHRHFYHQFIRDTKGNPAECRASGQCKTWKTRPDEFKLPVKYGLYSSFYITNDNAVNWCLTEEDAMLYPLRKHGDWNLFMNKTGLRPTKFICSQCHDEKDIPKEPSCTTGYAFTGAGLLICYECDGKNDLQDMNKKGFTYLYLSKFTDGANPDLVKEFGLHTALNMKSAHYIVQNWCGTLKYPVLGYTEGKHNIAKYRIDFWFMGPDKFIWHGIALGDSEYCRCVRTKRTKM